MCASASLLSLACYFPPSAARYCPIVSFASSSSHGRRREGGAPRATTLFALAVVPLGKRNRISCRTICGPRDNTRETTKLAAAFGGSSFSVPSCHFVTQRTRVLVVSVDAMRSSSFDGDDDGSSAEDFTNVEERGEESVEDVTVDFIGDGLLGPRKWLGAATIIDQKTKETTFYGVPSHARRVLKVEPQTGRVSVVGPDLGDRKFKYLRGVTSVDQEDEEPTIFALPAWGDSVLRSDFNREEDNEQPEIANWMEELCLHDVNDRTKWEKKWMWHGGQIAHKKDGNLYAIPCNAKAVLRVDVKQAKRGKNATEKAKAISMVGEDLISKMSGAHNNKFYGGITGSDGNIYGVPYCADKVLKIIPDAINPRVELLDGDGALHEIPKGENFKWHGGTYCPIDECIYGFPSHADKILRIHCKTGKVTQIGGNFPEDMNEGRYKWGGGAVDREGRVYAIPSDCACVLRIDPRTTVKAKKTITEDNNNNNNNNASLNNDCDDFESESKRGAPSSTGTGVRGEGFRKVIFDFNKAREQSYSMERTNSKKKKQTVVEVEEPLVEFLGVGVPGMLPNLRNKWQGGVLANDGMIYGVPCDAPYVLRINPETAECSFIGGDLGTMEDKYQGGFLAHDGCIYCIPENAEHVMRIHPPGSTAYPKPQSLKAHNVAVETQVPLTKSQRKKFLNRRNRERSGSSKIGSVVKKNRSCCGPSPRVCPESRPRGCF